jgi:hypothetical protein
LFTFVTVIFLFSSFGEIMVWIGIFLSAASVFDANTNAGYVALLSPILTAWLLLFVSGIPLGEERYDRKFGHLAEYIEYKRTTSPLIPMPAALYAVIPSFARLLCCFELPMYNKIPLAVGVKYSQETEDERKKKRNDKDSESESSENNEHEHDTLRQGQTGYQASG